MSPAGSSGFLCKLGASTIDHDGDGYAPSGGDCNDTNPAIHPGAVEVCNGVDDDCNGIVDDEYQACRWKMYVTNESSNSVSVFDANSNFLYSIPVGASPTKRSVADRWEPVCRPSVRGPRAEI